MNNLRDSLAKAKITHRLRRIQEQGNLGDYKVIGDGVNELRVKSGPGYRIYFMREGNQLIVLLVGGDKSTQDRDIDKAKKLAKDIKRQLETEKEVEK